MKRTLGQMAEDIIKGESKLGGVETEDVLPPKLQKTELTPEIVGNLRDQIGELLKNAEGMQEEMRKLFEEAIRVDEKGGDSRRRALATYDKKFLFYRLLIEYIDKFSRTIPVTTPPEKEVKPIQSTLGEMAEKAWKAVMDRASTNEEWSGSFCAAVTGDFPPEAEKNAIPKSLSEKLEVGHRILAMIGRAKAEYEALKNSGETEGTQKIAELRVTYLEQLLKILEGKDSTEIL